MEQDESKAPLLNLSFNTASYCDFEELANSFCSVGLHAEYQFCFSHMAEIITNIGQHARCNPEEDVAWSLVATATLDYLAISICDEGRGIHSSISERAEKNLTNQESMELAVGGGADRAQRNRGLGLKTILDSTRRNELLHFEIESSSCVFTAHNDVQEIRASLEPVIGTKVTIWVPFRGGLE
jgi:hypothetical protein